MVSTHWYLKAAESGDADAELNVGLAYANGYGLAQDEVAAFMWLRKAEEQNDLKAAYYLGFAYAGGQGVPEDDAQALYWIKKYFAADTGIFPDGVPDFFAEKALATGLLNGENGIPQNDQAGAYWLTKSQQQ